MMSAFSVMNSLNEAPTVIVAGFAVRSAAPSVFEIMTAGISSSKPSEPPIAVGSPATLLTMTTAVAPLALALATFWLNVQAPRLMIATLPETDAGTLAAAQPLSAVSAIAKVPAGIGAKSPTAPRAVPPV